MNTDHTCSYYCDRPECIRAQRDELREKVLGKPLDVWGQGQGLERFRDAAMQRVKSMQQWPRSGWQRGCQVCNIGSAGQAIGYVCPRSDCPTKITCEVSYE